jgi:hypothetical protein
MSGASPLISGEACDEFLDSHCEESESDDCWLVGYPQGGLIQKYLRGDVAIAFRRAESPSGETEQNGFIIQMKKAGFNIGAPCGDVGLRDEWFNGKKSFVFPQNIELMDGVENVVPSIVSLCVFDRGCFAGRDPLFVFDSRYGSQKVGASLSNGEVGLAVRFYAVAREKRRHENIQGGSSGIYNGSYVAMNERVQRDAEISNKEFPIFVGRIRLWDNLVWALPLPIHKSLLQDWDLGLGPIDCSFGV